MLKLVWLPVRIVRLVHQAFFEGKVRERVLDQQVHSPFEQAEVTMGVGCMEHVANESDEFPMLLVHLMQSEREIIIPFYERHQNPTHQAPRFRNAYGHITCSRLSAGNPACSARYLYAAASRPLMRESSTPACAHPIASYMGI
jgi:hypothetical protein